MSVAATNFVWYASPVEGSDRLVLLALADFADEDGNCFGSWGKLCQKTRLCRATVATSLRRLQEGGHLVLVKKGHRKLAGDGAEASIWKIPGVTEMGLNFRPVQNLDPSGLNLRPKWSKSQTQVVQDLDPNIKKHEEQKERKSADAPAPATVSPSPPVSGSVIPRPKKPKAVAADLSALQLPHGAGFRKWWDHFLEHRANPIKGRRNPLTLRAAEIIIGELSAVNEQQAVESIKKCIACGWVKPFPEQPRGEAPKVVPLRQGPIQPSEAERRMLEMEARMKGAA